MTVHILISMLIARGRVVVDAMNKQNVSQLCFRLNQLNNRPKTILGLSHFGDEDKQPL